MYKDKRSVIIFTVCFYAQTIYIYCVHVAFCTYNNLDIIVVEYDFHRKQIILWGHGISVKRYLAEEKKCNWLLRFMISMSDGVWLYTDKEVDFSTKVWAHLLCDSDDYAMPDLD